MATTFTPIYAFDLIASGDTGWGASRNANATDMENELARSRVVFLSPTVGATTTCDLSQTVGARVFVFTVSQATTVAFTNVPSASFSAEVCLVITNGSAFVLTWPASVSWLGGVAPTLKASGVDLVEMRTKDGGTTWYASLRADKRVQLGTSTAAAGVVTVPNMDNTTTASGAGSPANLKSYALPANALAANGQAIRVTAWGTTANNGNAKALRIAFGATLVANFTLATGTAAAWIVKALVSRTGAATQDAVQEYGQHSSTSATGPNITTPAETLSGAVTVQCSCTQTSAADVVQEGLLVEYLG